MINDFKTEITKKDIKLLNDLNQDLKNLYNVYYIYGDIASNASESIIVGSGSSKIINHGVLVLINTLFGDEPIKFISDNLYKVVKDHKKDITHISVKDSDIFFEGKESYLIGRTNLLLDKNNIDVFKSINDKFSSFVPDIEIDETGVIGLVTNECKTIKYKDYKTRITRELMAGLKKKHIIHISFEDVNDEIFNMKLMVDRDTVITIHEYRCLRM